jgi:hypothetical protein
MLPIGMEKPEPWLLDALDAGLLLRALRAPPPGGVPIELVLYCTQVRPGPGLGCMGMRMQIREGCALSHGAAALAHAAAGAQAAPRARSEPRPGRPRRTTPLLQGARATPTGSPTGANSGRRRGGGSAGRSLGSDDGGDGGFEEPELSIPQLATGLKEGEIKDLAYLIVAATCRWERRAGADEKRGGGKKTSQLTAERRQRRRLAAGCPPCANHTYNTCPPATLKRPQGHCRLGPAADRAQPAGRGRGARGGGRAGDEASDGHHRAHAGRQGWVAHSGGGPSSCSCGRLQQRPHS